MRKKVIGATAWALLATLVPIESAPGSEPDAPTADVARFVGPNDTLLAYQSGDLFGPGLPGAVLIVRHPIPDGAYDFDRNPCDLVILKGKGTSATQFAKGSTTVDCVYNDLNKRLGPLALNDNVEIKPGSIIFINQKDRGADRFYFRYSTARPDWYLERVTTAFPGVDGITTEEASYPAHFGWTPLSQVSPRALAKVLSKHKAVQK